MYTSKDVAAKMVFMCAKYAEQIQERPDATEAEKRHALALRALGIVKRDRLERERTNKLKGRE